MYVENEGGMKVSTSSLNEELGNVEFILSDKTGTLTKNNMKCCGFSMGGYVYEARAFEYIDSSEALLKEEDDNPTEQVKALKEDDNPTEQVKALLMKCNEGRECSKLEGEYITNFLRALFLCNSVGLSLSRHC